MSLPEENDIPESPLRSPKLFSDEPTDASALAGLVFTERGTSAKLEFGFIDMEERPLGELKLNREAVPTPAKSRNHIKHEREQSGRAIPPYMDTLGGRNWTWMLIFPVIGVLVGLCLFWLALEKPLVATKGNFTPLPAPIATHSLMVIVLLGLGLLSIAGQTLLIWNICFRRKKLAEGAVGRWQDSVRRSVRVSIGETRCLRETVAGETGLLIEDDPKAYPHLGCLFYRLEFSLTMLPDTGCSVEQGQLSLQLIPDTEQAKLPFFVRLHPEQEIVEEKKKLTRGSDGNATFKIPTIGEIGGRGKIETESELQVETVTISSWGAGEQVGGWRFYATATRSIKTSITGLVALVAIPEGRKCKGRFRAAAHLRRAKKSADLLVPEPEAFIEYEFPPTLEIPSTALPVSDPVPV